MPRPSAPLLPPVFHILLALSSEDLHGLGIATAVEDASGGTVELGPGTLYRSLKEMVRQGALIEVSSPQGTDPRRKYYRSTDLGRELLREEAARLARIVDLARERKVLEGPTS